MAIGNMSLNSELVRPDVAVITNIAPAHLEYHRDLDTIALKKARIFDGMKAGGLAVICRDIAQFDLIAEKARQARLTLLSYGEHPQADIRLLHYHPGEAEVEANGQRYILNLSAHGKHLVLNAMAILAIARHQKSDTNKIIQRLNSFKAIKGRGEVSSVYFQHKNLTIYDEAYNANPLSMRAALEAFVCVDRPLENKLVILGDMLELGANSAAYHHALVEFTAQQNLERMLFVGKEITQAVKALAEQNDMFKGKFVKTFENRTALLAEIGSLISDGDHILIKASNGIRLEGLFDMNA